jgi:chromosome segregation ATPase
MTAVTIDTLELAGQLREAGVDEKPAAAIAQAIKRGVESTPAPAEVAQIKGENADIKAENADAKTRLTRVEDRLTKIETDIGDIKIRLTKMETDIGEVKTDLASFKAEVRSEMRWQRWMTCAIIVLVVSDIILQNL